MKKILIVFAFLMAMPYVSHYGSRDYDTYYVSIKSPKCCFYIEKEWWKLPFTHFMVDSWTEPKWRLSEDGKEEFLVSEGLVNGKVEFWKKLDSRKPLKTV